MIRNLSKTAITEILFLPLFTALYYFGYFSNIFLIITGLCIAITIIDKSDISVMAKNINFAVLCNVILFSFGIFLYQV